ncbi:MAG: DNA cytosine methyltransferase [Xenococcaceae cyanobacterium]
MDKEKPKFIDLFAGIGGFRLAFEQAGYKCVYSCEIDSACQEVYFNNFGEKPKSANNHGCQVIVNGIIPTLKYYLRLITSVETFVKDYSQLIEQERELQAIHKIQWNNILKTLE